ncbi:MAG TPA: hypothetical protein VJI66_03100 [Candidatus Paceibacterota bacterium]
MNYKKLIVRLFIFSFLSFSFFAIAGQARAANDVTGWAWSDTTGWISLNCANTGAGGCSNSYKVTFATTTSDTIGELSGYAWSSNIGWISFNETTGCPSGTCKNSINMTTGVVTGWAKILSMGDDGWIELAGVNHLSSQSSNSDISCTINCAGVTYNNGLLAGFAWGNIGWIHFNTMVEGCNNVGCTQEPPASAPTCLLTPSKNPVASGGENITLSWTSNDATSCTGTGFSTGGATSGTSGSIFVNISTPFSLQCVNVANPTPVTCSTVTVTVAGPPPPGDFDLWFNDSATRVKTAKIKPGRTAKLNWDTSSVYFAPDTCVGEVRDSTGDIDVNGWDIPSPAIWEDNALNGSPNAKIVTPSANGVYTFQMHCEDNSGGTVFSNEAVLTVSQSTIEER